MQLTPPEVLIDRYKTVQKLRELRSAFLKAYRRHLFNKAVENRFYNAPVGVDLYLDESENCAKAMRLLGGDVDYSDIKEDWSLEKIGYFGWYLDKETDVRGFWLSEVAFTDERLTTGGEISESTIAILKSFLQDNSQTIVLNDKLDQALSNGSIIAVSVLQRAEGGFLIGLPIGDWNFEVIAEYKPVKKRNTRGVAAALKNFANKGFSKLFARTQPEFDPSDKFNLIESRLPFEPEMIIVPEGVFLMGSSTSEPGFNWWEGSQHQVHVRSFAIGRTTITFSQFEIFAKDTGAAVPDDQGMGKGERPVISVPWFTALAYTERLSEKTGHSYRLPTESEWEYAARAGTNTAFSTGPCITTQQANYSPDPPYPGCNQESGMFRNATVVVGSLPPNPWGLCEVHGNVWEWVQDRWHDTYNSGISPRDGSEWKHGVSNDHQNDRVVRGGCYYESAASIRSASRTYNAFRGKRRNETLRSIGFRVARDLISPSG